MALRRSGELAELAPTNRLGEAALDACDGSRAAWGTAVTGFGHAEGR